jgi:hypothetical protein
MYVTQRVNHWKSVFFSWIELFILTDEPHKCLCWKLMKNPSTNGSVSLRGTLWVRSQMLYKLQNCTSSSASICVGSTDCTGFLTVVAIWLSFVPTCTSSHKRVVVIKLMMYVRITTLFNGPNLPPTAPHNIYTYKPWDNSGIYHQKIERIWKIFSKYPNN